MTVIFDGNKDRTGCKDFKRQPTQSKIYQMYSMSIENLFQTDSIIISILPINENRIAKENDCGSILITFTKKNFSENDTELSAATKWEILRVKFYRKNFLENTLTLRLG